MAALTGVVLRLAPLVGLPGGLAFDHLRQAHSHLMTLGWATPLLFAWISQRTATRLEAGGGRVPPARGVIAWAALATAWATYPAYLAWGYEPASIAGVDVPVAAALSGLHAMTWVAFAAWYVTARRRIGCAPAFRAWDVALALLLLSLLAVAGRGVVGASGLDSAVARDLPVHVFLVLFMDGWLVLAVIGLATESVGRIAAGARAGAFLLAAGLPGSALLTLSAGPLPAWVRPIGIGSAALVTLGLFLLVRALRAGGTPGGVWIVVVAALGVRLVAGPWLVFSSLAAGTVPPGQRMLYLHLVGLGIVSLGLVAAAVDRRLVADSTARRWWVPGTALLLVSLLPLSRIGLPTGRWVLHVAAFGALGPLLAALRSLIPGRVGLRVAQRPSFDVGWSLATGAMDPRGPIGGGPESGHRSDQTDASPGPGSGGSPALVHPGTAARSGTSRRVLREGGFARSQTVQHSGGFVDVGDD